MPRVATLKERCLEEIAWMFKFSDWSTDSEEFKVFPSHLIDELIAKVIDVSTRERLRNSDLKLLLTSGRVTEFILDDTPKAVNASSRTIRKFLMYLSTACDNLTRIKLNLKRPKRSMFRSITPALNSLLSNAENITFVESNIEFDVSLLLRSPKLKKLVINFKINRDIFYSFELASEAPLTTNNSLRYLEFCKEENYDLAYPEVVKVLRYCTELIYFNFDIAESLEWMHGKEFDKGTLTQCYKIESCILGEEDFCPSEFTVCIASETCPSIKNLSIKVRHSDVITELKNFRNIKHLTLTWISPSHCDYMSEVQPLLEKQEFGQNLTELQISNFCNVDVSSVSACCPNIRYLYFYFCISNDKRNVILLPMLPKLKILHIVSCDAAIIQSEELIQLLCTAVNLERLVLGSGIAFTDHTLESTLIENPLSKLEEMVMDCCELTLLGVLTLAIRATSLKRVGLTHSEMEDEIVAIFAEINPEVQLIIGTRFYEF